LAGALLALFFVGAAMPAAAAMLAAGFACWRSLADAAAWSAMRRRRHRRPVARRSAPACDRDAGCGGCGVRLRAACARRADGPAATLRSSRVRLELWLRRPFRQRRGRNVGAAPAAWHRHGRRFDSRRFRHRLGGSNGCGDRLGNIRGGSSPADAKSTGARLTGAKSTGAKSTGAKSASVRCERGRILLGKIGFRHFAIGRRIVRRRNDLGIVAISADAVVSVGDDAAEVSVSAGLSASGGLGRFSMR